MPEAKHCTVWMYRKDTIQYHGRLQTRKIGQVPILVFITPRPALSSHQHRTLVCLYLSGAYTVHTHQLIPLLLAKSGLSCWIYPTDQLLFPQHLAIHGFPQSDHTVSKLSVNAGSLLNTVKQASRPQVILKTQPPICLDYRARNRTQLFSFVMYILFLLSTTINLLNLVGISSMKRWKDFPPDKSVICETF